MTVKRSTAINLFGGTVGLASVRLGVTRQAIHQWEKDGCMHLAACNHVLASWVRRMARDEPAMQRALKQLKLPADALRVPHSAEDEDETQSCVDGGDEQITA